MEKNASTLANQDIFLAQLSECWSEKPLLNNKNLRFLIGISSMKPPKKTHGFWCSPPVPPYLPPTLVPLKVLQSCGPELEKNMTLKLTGFSLVVF